MTSFAVTSTVRIRSVPASEPADTLTIDEKEKAIILKRQFDQYPKKVNAIFPKDSSQTDIWNVVGEPGYDVVVTKNEHACVVVWGGRDSGKTFTCLGDDNGIVQSAMRAFADKQDANMSVVMIRNDQIQDLANIKHDNVRVKYEEEKGIVFEGSVTVKIPTLESAKAHLDKCLKGRDEVWKEHGSSSATTFMVYVFGLGEGTFTVVECCSSDRIVMAEPTEEQKKENALRHKQINSFTRVLLDQAVHADSNAIGWKDCKATRFLQPALSKAMEGAEGFFGLVVCVNPVKTATIETHINVSLAEGAVKQESLKTISDYKEELSRYEERTEGDTKDAPGLAAEKASAEQTMNRVKAENADKARELEEKVDELKTLVPRTQKSIDADIEKLKKDIEREKAAFMKSLEAEGERLQNIGKNSASIVVEESKKASAKIDAEIIEESKKIKAEIAEAEKEYQKQKELVAQADRLRHEAKEKEKDAMKPVKEAEHDLKKLEKELKSSGKCREDGMEEEDINRMVPVWEARDELDEIDKEVVELAKEVMSLDYVHTRKFGAPSDSDSDSDSDDSDASETESEKAEREREEAEEAEREAIEEKKRREEEAFEKEHAFVKDAVYREKFLHDLVDKVMCYLEYGTNVAVLTSKGFSRHFLYMTRNRKQWALVAEVSEGQVPVKKDPVRVIPIEQVAVMTMGQHSPNFMTFLKKVQGRADPPRHEQPPAPEELSAANMHRYYYRSFSLQMKRESEECLDIVCDTQTDFEALVVAYNRLTTREAAWGRKMFIDLADRVDELKPYERKLCEDLHLTPIQYFNAKEKVLADPEVLYMTLHDMRLLTTLDLYHCQCLMDVFMQQKWVAVRDLVYFKYWEDHERYEAEAGQYEEGEGEGEGAYDM